MTHNLTFLRRCRGIPVAANHFTGCAYGLDQVEPFVGTCDCPVCDGSFFEPLGTNLRHSDFGDPQCCGCLIAVLRENSLAEIICDECQFIIRTVQSSDLSRTLTEMELTLDSAVEMCPNCRFINIFPGFTHVTIYTCRNCAQATISSIYSNPV